MRRIAIEMFQCSRDTYQMEVPDDMSDEDALDMFRDKQVWVYEDHHATIVEDQEFRVVPGNPDEKYPLRPEDMV